MSYTLPLTLILLALTVHANKNCSEWVKIKDGSNCWQIANDNGITVESLYPMNPGLNCDKLAIGKRLCLSSIKPGKPKCTERYKVQEGDFCSKIWKAHGLSEEEFLEMNEDFNCDKLQPGHKVCVSTS